MPPRCRSVPPANRPAAALSPLPGAPETSPTRSCPRPSLIHPSRPQPNVSSPASPTVYPVRSAVAITVAISRNVRPATRPSAERPLSDLVQCAQQLPLRRSHPRRAAKPCADSACHAPTAAPTTPEISPLASTAAARNAVLSPPSRVSARRLWSQTSTRLRRPRPFPAPRREPSK
jgi:hypothetical protein